MTSTPRRLAASPNRSLTIVVAVPAPQTKVTPWTKPIERSMSSATSSKNAVSRTTLTELCGITGARTCFAISLWSTALRTSDAPYEVSVGIDTDGTDAQNVDTNPDVSQSI